MVKFSYEEIYEELLDSSKSTQWETHENTNVRYEYSWIITKTSLVNKQVNITLQNLPLFVKKLHIR